MSDPTDRPLGPLGGEPDAAEAGATADRAEVMPAPTRTARPRAVTMPMLIGVALLAVAVAAAVWFDGKRTQRALRLEVAQRLVEIESSAQAGAKSQAQLATDLREAQAKVSLLEARLAESQAQQAALEALYRDLAPSRDEIAISEIEQVLVVASQQLQLAVNV